MKPSYAAADERIIFNLKDGGTVIGLAIFAPLALQGVLFSAFWLLAQYGSDPAENVGGVSFPTGSTISLAATILIALVVRYVVLWAYWFMLVEKVCLPRREAFLAALPVVGIWWSLRIASITARSKESGLSIGKETKLAVGGFVGVVLLLFPLGMQAATAADKNEAERLATPCISDSPAVAVEEPVFSVGKRQMSARMLSDLVDEVKSTQRSAAGERSGDWQFLVANRTVSRYLVEEAALIEGLAQSVTIGDSEKQLQIWRDQYGERFVDVFVEYGIAPSQLEEYACYALLEEQVLRRLPFDADPNSEYKYLVFMRQVAEEVGVSIDSSIGYWNGTRLRIETDKPKMPENDDSAERTETSSPSKERSFATRVTYEIDSIPTNEYQNTLEWKADICAGSVQLLQPEYRNRIQLFERVAGAWQLVRDAKADTQRGGRCPQSQVNIFIGASEEEPPANWNDKSWKTCREYQVRIPETPTFQATSVDLCVATKADTASQGA